MANPMHVPELEILNDNGTEGSFSIEPLQRGFGVTLGNSLRRVLLSSLPGAAVTAFTVDGASHEFSSLPGVTEDLVQITLNLKQLRFKVFSDEPQVIEINKKGKGAVTARDIKTTSEVEVVNSKQKIATLDNAKASLKMSLKVEPGRGYLPVEDQPQEGLEIGMIAIDALFSPVRRVRYKVGQTRVGETSGLDKLDIEVTTDGSITPTDAIQQAAGIIVQQLVPLTGQSAPASDAVPAEDQSQEPDELNFSVEDLNLSARTTNALMKNNINTVRDLIQVGDSELKVLKGFGSKAYQEVIAKLKELELR